MSDKNIEKLQAKSKIAKSQIRKWLIILRCGTSIYHLLIVWIREDVHYWGFSLAEIGTSEEELEKLRVLGCKTMAKELLDTLRKGTTNTISNINIKYNELIHYIRSGVLKKNFSLAEIGTSEEELKELEESYRQASEVIVELDA